MVNLLNATQSVRDPRSDRISSALGNYFLRVGRWSPVENANDRNTSRGGFSSFGLNWLLEPYHPVNRRNGSTPLFDAHQSMSFTLIRIELDFLSRGLLRLLLLLMIMMMMINAEGPLRKRETIANCGSTVPRSVEYLLDPLMKQMNERTTQSLEGIRWLWF